MSTRMPWFRMYADFLNDPKMIALAFEDQRHFVGVLALKCDGAIDDVADGNLLDRIVAQRLWIDHAIIRDVKRRLVAAGLIDANWQPLAWDRRQMRSDTDSTAAERQRRYRESRKGNALRHAPSNAAVTRLDTDTDTESPLPPTGGDGDPPVGNTQQPTFPPLADLVEPQTPAEPAAPIAVAPAAPAGPAAPAQAAAAAAPAALVVVQPSMAGLVCRAMKAAGISDPNPGNPRLLSLIAAGADVDEFIAAASKAATKRSGFAYALAIVENDRLAAAATAPKLHQGRLPGSAAAADEGYSNLLRGAI